MDAIFCFFNDSLPSEKYIELNWLQFNEKHVKPVPHDLYN